MSRTEVGRRRFLRAAGIAGVIAIAGCSAPTNDDGGGAEPPLEEPDYGGYLDDAVDATGVQYEHAVEASGTATYYCDPHETIGMKGAVHVP
jgi:hypothetical protein